MSYSYVLDYNLAHENKQLKTRAHIKCAHITRSGNLFNKSTFLDLFSRP